MTTKISFQTISNKNVADVDDLAKSAFVETRTFETQMIEHAFLEPESSNCIYKRWNCEVLSQGQGVFDDKQIASF